MSALGKTSYTDFMLPTNIVTKKDVARLIQECEALDVALTEKRVRKKAGAKSKTLPPIPSRLQAFLDVNPTELENGTKRSAYIKQLRLLKDSVAVMHMTFAVEADEGSIQKLLAWVRQSIHPQAVLEVHIQPALVAGVYIRTENHIFDLSVRNALTAKREDLQKALGALRG